MPYSEDNALAQSYFDKINKPHPLHAKYLEAWTLATRSYYGGEEYKNGRYLKQYSIDNTTPAETIQTYDIDTAGVQHGKYLTQVVHSRSQAEAGQSVLNNFYEEKLRNVPVLPYLRLYVSEYNSILFRSPPYRKLPQTPSIAQFISDVDGEGNSINEFWSQVDVFTTVCGVVWISCIKPTGSDTPVIRYYLPQDVKNWEYHYGADGKLSLQQITISVATEIAYSVYLYITPEFIDTVFVVSDPEQMPVLPPEAEQISDPDADSDSTQYYRIRQLNELGYVPVRPVYQSSKIYNGVGHTPCFDIAQIQRSVYADMAEIYSGITYGSHPVCVVDEQTLNLNGGQIGAEPGSQVRVESNLSGQPNHVFEFVAPPLESLEQIRALIEQKIEKMNQVAMVRSEELIRASRSGAQIEAYDSKLEAFVRKKAVSMENAEYQVWNMWYDWQNQTMPADLVISYNRHYGQRGLETEIAELNSLMLLVEQYQAFEPETDLATEARTDIAARIRQLLFSTYSENSI